MVELQRVVPSPECTVRATNNVVKLVALSKVTALVASRCQPMHLFVLLDWFGDPLSVGITSDSFMEWINENKLKKFVCEIFANPVRIQGSQSPHTALSSAAHQRLQANFN